MNKLEPMTVVKHFKGNQYIVLGVAKHTELNTDLSDVDKDKYPDVQQKERFEYVGSVKDVLTAKAKN